MDIQSLLNERVGDIVTHYPQAATVFEQRHIDFCCGGGAPLAKVCQEKGIDAEEVLNQVNAQITRTSGGTETDWSTTSLSDLADHIEQTHHAFLRAELPGLTELINRVCQAHGTNHPELEGVRQVFAAFRQELESHMLKEERILFPAVRELEANQQSISFPFGSLSNPIRVMEHEHDDAGHALSEIRRLTSDYQPPEGTCRSYQLLYQSLAALERDMHLHIHKENNILFPKAQKLEESIRQTNVTRT